MCEPALKALADEPRFEELPLFAGKEVGRHEEEALEGAILAAEQDVSYLPERYKSAPWHKRRPCSDSWRAKRA
jgi:hypothetical protein